MLTLNLPYLLQIYQLLRDWDSDKNEKVFFFHFLTEVMHLGKKISNHIIYHLKEYLPGPWD